MSYALIDNASLTAVQRVLGQVVVKTPDTVNGDLSTFENLIQAILFYDDLLCIDNYKEKFKEERRKNFPFIRFLQPDDYKLEKLVDKAQSEAKTLRPEIRGGEFADEDFREFFDLLKMNIVCTWDLSASVYYLTMKMLGQPNTPEFHKYSKLSAAIFSELSDVGNTIGRWSTDVRLVGSNGTEHTKAAMAQADKAKERGFGGTTRSLDMFVASLNWLAYKSIYYSLAAKYFKADTFLHPIRHAFQIHWMKKTGAYGHDFTAKLVQALSKNISTSVSKIIDNGRTSVTSLEVPIFSAWLAVQSGDIRNVIDAAIELKSSQNFKEIRGLLKEIRIAYDEKGLSPANKLVDKWEHELHKAADNLKKVYGLKTDQGVPSSYLMKVYNSVASVSGLPQFPEFDFKIPMPDFIQNNLSQSFSNIYKDVGRELANIERMGGVRDLMARKFEFSHDPYVPPKTEAPEYRHVSLDWKLPM